MLTSFGVRRAAKHQDLHATTDAVERARAEGQRGIRHGPSTPRSDRNCSPCVRSPTCASRTDRILNARHLTAALTTDVHRTGAALTNFTLRRSQPATDGARSLPDTDQIACDKNLFNLKDLNRGTGKGGNRDGGSRSDASTRSMYIRARARRQTFCKAPKWSTAL